MQASHNADLHIQRSLNNSNVSFLQFVKPYGNNARYSVPGQTFKITNTQLITKLYPSFPIRFELSLPELLSITRANSQQLQLQSANASSIKSSNASDSALLPLFSISSLELLLKHKAKESLELDSAGDFDEDIYLNFFTKIITSNKLVPFETFNHPISQVFAIDFHNDTIDDLRKLIVDFRNFNFPKFFQIDDLLIHVFILYDPNVSELKDLIELQNNVKKLLSILSTLIGIPQEPVNLDGEGAVSVTINENSTIEEDLQRISLNQGNESLKVSQSIDTMIKKRLYEYINKFIIPHMEKKIRVWDDLVLSPKKSITGRFFSVSKLFFNNNSNSNKSSPEPQSSSSNSTSSSFNYQENYYHKSSPEQTIRKLADWSLILKDFKYAYSTYDLIKKDYTNDKAWVYVASTQEICIVSLLLAQTQQLNQNPNLLEDSTPPPGASQQQSITSVVPDRNTFRKIRHDIIEPYCDNLLYTFKSRFNLRSYGLKALLVFVELLLCLSLHQNSSWWWNDLIEKYLYKCIDDFEKHLVNGGQVIRALLFERLGYSFGKCVYLGQMETMRLVERRQREVKVEVEEGMYVNPHKIRNRDVHFTGLTKYKKSSLWYLLSIREWLELKNYKQVGYLIQNIQCLFNIKELTDQWYDRNDLLLGFAKRCLIEAKESDESKVEPDQNDTAQLEGT